MPEDQKQALQVFFIDHRLTINEANLLVKMIEFATDNGYWDEVDALENETFNKIVLNPYL